MGRGKEGGGGMFASTQNSLGHSFTQFAFAWQLHRIFCRHIHIRTLVSNLLGVIVVVVVVVIIVT